MVIKCRRNLVDYFKKNLKKGYTEESLKWALINQSYPKTTIDEAFLEATRELADEAPILKDKPQIHYEVYDEKDKMVELKKPWWKRIFG